MAAHCLALIVCQGEYALEPAEGADAVSHLPAPVVPIDLGGCWEELPAKHLCRFAGGKALAHLDRALRTRMLRGCRRRRLFEEISEGEVFFRASRGLGGRNDSKPSEMVIFE